MIEDKKFNSVDKGIADNIYNNEFEALTFNPTRSSTDRNDIEFYQKGMGREIADRVSVRNFFRQRYGRPFRMEHGRMMSDLEVDNQLRYHYNIETDFIDYTKIKDQQTKEYQMMTGDAKDLKWHEYATGTFGAFLDYLERGLEVSAQSLIGGGAKDVLLNLGTLGTASLAKQKSKSTSDIDKKAKILSSKVDEFIDIVPDKLRGDLEEIRARAGDESLSSFSATIAAFLSNAPNLASSALPIYVAAPMMMMQEKSHALDQFYDLFDVPSILPDDASDDLIKRYDQANTLATLYGSGSGMIEYFQTGALRKLAGVKRFNFSKMQRQFAGTFLKQLGITGVHIAENVSEEVAQQLLNNAIYNYGVDIAREQYGIEKEKVNLTDGFKDSALGAARVGVVTRTGGGVKTGIQRKIYKDETKANLEELGFDSKTASKHAREMLNAADNEDKFRQVTQNIQQEYSELDIRKKAEAEQQKATQIYDETGLITKDGSFLTNADFDKFATLYNESELKNLIKKDSNKQLFVDAVYGDIESRIKYNNLITTDTEGVTVINLEPPEKEETEEGVDRTIEFGDEETSVNYEVDEPTSMFINKIFNGDYDNDLEIEEGQTIEQARQKAIQQILETKGKPLVQTKDQDESIPLETKPKTKPKENKNKRRRIEKERQKMVDRAQRSLRIVAPNIKIEFAKDSNDFIKRTGKHGNGFYDMNNNIILNPETATQGTVVHEIVHAVFHTKFKTDENIRKASDRILNEMLKHSLPASTRKKITSFQQKYIEYAAQQRAEGLDVDAERTLADLNEEGIAQIADILTSNYEALKPSVKAQIQDFFANIFKGVISVSDEGRAIQLMKVLAGNPTTGQRIADEDLSLLDDIGKEIIPGYQSPAETGYSASKFQLSHSDIDTRMTYYYDIDSEKWQKLESDGNVTRDKSITDFKDSFVILHQPDAMFSGSIERNGRVLVKGKGGLYYPLKFNEEGYFWASTESGAAGMVTKLNQSAQANGGKVLMALTSAPRQKVFGSTAGSNAILEVFDDIVSDNNYNINRETFNKITQKASIELGLNTSDLSVIRQKLGVTETNFDQRAKFVNKLIREIGKEAKTNTKFGKELLKFYESIQIFDRPESEVLRDRKQVLKEKSAAKIAESKTQQGDLGTVGLRHLAEMLAEPVLKNAIPGEPTVDRKMGGHIYAVLEVDGPVEVVKTDGHESYPFAIRSKDGKSPVVHMLKDRHMWDTAVVNPDTDSYYENRDDMDVIYPTTVGISGKPLKVNPRGKAQLSSDYMLNFDRIPQVVAAIKRYFAGEITYEQFVEIQQKFDPIRKFNEVPQIPTAKQMKNVLTKEQAPLVNKKPKEGTIVGLRLDIPAYTKTDKDGKSIGQYVVTMHAKGGKAIAYTSTARAKNVRMVSPTATAAKIAVGIKNKTSVSVMQGEYIEATDQKNYELALELMNDSNWTQIGYNPFRRSFFYVREGKDVGMPVLGAEEVVQIGGLVFAKNPEIVTPDHPKFRLQNEAQKEALGILRNDGKFQLTDVEETPKKKIRMATFFSGLGTLELGLLNSKGVEVVATAEKEQGIVDTYNVTHGTAETPTDILKLKIEDLIDKAIDFLHMSPPCQAFSAAREKGTVTEEDFKLEMKIARKLARIITAVQPKNLTIENAPAYRDSEQYDVIRKALQKSGYKVEELIVNSANYGGNSMRRRLIVRASKTELPSMPQESKTGDWYEAMLPFLNDAPVDEAIQFDGRSGKTMEIVVDLLARIEAKQFDPNVAYIAPGGDGFFKPQGEPGHALTANFLYDAKKRKQGIKEKALHKDGSLLGSSGVMRVALPVRQMVKEKGLRVTAKHYGVSVKQIKEAYESTGFLFKRGTTPMLLAYMNLPTDQQLSGRVKLDRAMLGNGIQGVVTKQFIEPMIGKAQLSDDFIERGIQQAQQELDARKNELLEKEKVIDEEPEEEYIDNEEEYNDAEDFYEDFVDDDYLFDEEEIDGATKLTLEEIRILMRNLGLGDLPLERGKRFATLIANAARDCNPNDVIDLATQALNEDLILNDQQHAMLVYRVTQLRNELDAIRDSIEGAQYQNTVVDLSAKYEKKLAEISLLVRADARSGSATGRALNARRIALTGDYSKVGVMRRALKAKNRLGNSDGLTDQEIKDLEKVQAPLQETQRKIEKLKNKKQKDLRTQDIAAGQKFVENEKKKRKTAVAKKSLNQKDKLIKRLQEKGYNLEGFGKSQLFNISPSLAQDIREMARILVYEGYNNLDQVVNEIKGIMPDTLEYDIYGAISGRVQRIPKTESEAKKILKSLTLQSDLMVQIDNALSEIFDPKRNQKPKSSEIQNLRKKLDQLKDAARQNSREEAAATKMLTEIDNIDKMLSDITRPIKKPTKARSESLEEIANKLFVKRTELRAQDRLILLKTIVEYGEPPKFTRKKRHVSSRLLEQYRAEITMLEKDIKETRKLKNQQEAKKRKEAEQLARLESLSQQVAGWYRDNVAPKQQKELSDVQLSIKEKQRLLKQQDRIAELTEILETGKMPEKDKPQLTDPMGYNETIKELQEQIRNQEWYQQMQQMRFEERRKKSVKAKIAEQERVISEGDYSTYLQPKEKKEILDPELKELLEIQRIQEREIRRAINKLKPKTALEKFADWVSLPRAFMATADMSATFRQAFLLGVRHPKQFVKAVKISAKAMIDPSFANQVMTVLENDEMSLIRETSGLFFSSLDTGLSTSEEAFSSGALETVYKLPGVGKPIATVMGASERHMVIMLNVMRAASFDAYYEANQDATDLELKSMAHYINTASGRGDLGNFEAAVQGLSALTFSPRFAASRFLVAPEALYKTAIKPFRGNKDKSEEERQGELRVAKEIAKHWGSLGVTTAIVYGLGMLAGAEVGDDPEESDFGQLIFGNTRIDIFAGMGPGARLLTKWANAGIMRLNGERTSVDLSQATMNTFFKYKASPWISGINELFTGKRYVTREDISAGRVLAERLIPISLSNVYQNIEDDASFSEIAAELSGEFLGLSIYTKSPYDKKRGGSLKVPTY